MPPESWAPHWNLTKLEMQLKLGSDSPNHLTIHEGSELLSVVAIGLNLLIGGERSSISLTRLKEVRDRLRDIDQTVTVITQNVMVNVDGIVDELSKQPDGSRFPMFVRAMQFSQRTPSDQTGRDCYGSRTGRR